MNKNIVMKNKILNLTGSPVWIVDADASALCFNTATHEQMCSRKAIVRIPEGDYQIPVSADELGFIYHDEQGKEVVFLYQRSVMNKTLSGDLLEMEKQYDIIIVRRYQMQDVTDLDQHDLRKYFTTSNPVFDSEEQSRVLIAYLALVPVFPMGPKEVQDTDTAEAKQK